MILITPTPLVTTDPEQFWPLPLKAIVDVYKASGSQITELKITANIEFEVTGFDVPHYCHYFMEETSTDRSPAYVVYLTDDAPFLEKVSSNVHWFYKNNIPVSLEHPETYEEVIAAKAILLSRSVGGKGSLINWKDGSDKLVWRIAGNMDNCFKEEFFRMTRCSTMKAVSNN